MLLRLLELACEMVRDRIIPAHVSLPLCVHVCDICIPAYCVVATVNKLDRFVPFSLQVKNGENICYLYASVLPRLFTSVKDTPDNDVQHK